MSCNWLASFVQQKSKNVWLIHLYGSWEEESVTKVMKVAVVLVGHQDKCFSRLNELSGWGCGGSPGII